MQKIVGIKFKRSPKIYYFEAGEYVYEMNGGVIVETSRGMEFGTVALMPQEVEDSKIVSPLKPIIRLATEKDIDEVNKRDAKRGEVMRIASEKIEKSKLNMKLVDAEYTFDGNKLILYFTAESRVDFRDLVRDLASSFHARIELRQIGSRDECRILGGIAPCGRACCCSDHMCDFAHVTIKMAKNQNLSLNPTKISGLCGRLMCCLAYENDHYVQTNKTMPKVGATVEISDGRVGVVTGLNQLKNSVNMKIDNKDKEGYTFEEIKLADLKFKPKNVANDDNDIEIDDEVKKLLD